MDVIDVDVVECDFSKKAGKDVSFISMDWLTRDLANALLLQRVVILCLVISASPSSQQHHHCLAARPVQETTS